MTRPNHAGAAAASTAALIRGRIRLIVVVCLTGVLMAAIGARPGLALGQTRVPAQQRIVTLSQPRRFRSRPDLSVRPIASVAARRPITGERTVLPVLATSIDSHGRAWLRVRLPGRVLGSPAPPRTGWILAVGTLISTTDWHIVVKLSARQVLIYRLGRELRSYAAVVGKPSTPTPVGEYFVEENVRMLPGQAGAPFALATSDRSNVLHEFDGGPGQIALHGLDNVGGQLGTAESHGCIRMADSAITWLTARIAPGIPISILP
jgi:hypothetical protein